MATGQKGLLSRSKAYTAQGTVEVYNVTYEARNRLTQQNWIVPGTGGGTFRLDNTYNVADQQVTLRYPGGTAGQQGELVTTGYNSVGQVNSVSGSSVSYVSSTTHDAHGQVTEHKISVAFSVEVALFLKLRLGRIHSIALSAGFELWALG